MYVIIGSHFVPFEGKFSYCISYCKDNIKCDIASNAPRCPLNNSVSIVQKLVVKLSNTTTMLFPPAAKTLSKWDIWDRKNRFLSKNKSDFCFVQNKSRSGENIILRYWKSWCLI